MSSTRAAKSLRTSERRLGEISWLQSGKCIRCFHNTRWNKAEESNASTVGKDDHSLSPRRRRAAAVTDELSALARSAPTPIRPPYPRNHDNEQRTAPSAARHGHSGGEEVRRTRSMSIQEALLGLKPTSERPRSPWSSIDNKTPQSERSKLEDFIDEWEGPRLSRRGLLRGGLGTSTLANRDTVSIIRDREMLVRPMQRRVRNLHPLRHGLTRPESATDTESVSKTGESKSQSKPVQEPTEREREKQAARLAIHQTMVRKILSGQYDGSDVLGGKEKYKQSTMNEVARAMALNPSYTGSDTTRFLNKIRGLLPAVVKPRSSNATAPAT